MASDFNRVILIGRLTRDPELRHTPSGTSVTSFTLVNNRNYTVNGDKREEVSYFDCVAWGKLGEVINEYCKRYTHCNRGRLQQQKWEDQEGKNRSKIIIVVDNFQVLSYPKAQGMSHHRVLTTQIALNMMLLSIMRVIPLTRIYLFKI